jgi:peptide chain release factor 1
MSAAVIAKYEKMAARAAELDALMADPAVAADPARVGALAREHGRLRRPLERWGEYRSAAAALAEAEAMAADASVDAEMRELARSEVADLKERRDGLMAALKDELLAGEDLQADSLIMEIRAGTGGDEAALFAGDLFEMYRRYAETKRWKVEVLSASEGDAGGFREIVMTIAGPDVWRELAFEGGGHRVQRVPKTETQGRIHTSAATVAVLPEPEETEVQVRWDDPKVIKEEAMRSSGPGGQNVNKVNSAVRLTHLETGIVVHIQGRDWHKNRAEARRVMVSRLYEHFETKRRAQREQARRTMIGSGDRNERVRTYNFPQDRCTDHRLNRNFPLAGIMAGGLDGLIAAMIDFDKEERLKAM